MTATIAYDLPMKNLIDELSATGHVTHTAYRKTSVTFHHNAGRLSHEGCLRVWTYREASAHFDIDGLGDACQYVKPNEYAWACGNTYGNQTSISIEMANATLSPDWTVAEVTWKNAARLGGWLFARVIGAAPTTSNVFFHKHWLSTSCAGPYMDTVYNQLLAEVQKWYNYYNAGGGGGTSAPPPTPSTKLAEDGYLGPNTIKAWQKRMGTPVDGVISRPSILVSTVQSYLNSKGARDRNGNKLVVDGYGIGSNQTSRYPSSGTTHTIEALQRYLGTYMDGYFSSPSSAVKALQHRLNAGTF